MKIHYTSMRIFSLNTMLCFSENQHLNLQFQIEVFKLSEFISKKHGLIWLHTIELMLYSSLV